MWDGTWFGAWDGVWFGTTEVGGGGGGTGGGAGGGPGTYTLPPGLTSQQKKAYAALVACAPCCESGSGSGSDGNCGCQACTPCGDYSPSGPFPFPEDLTVTIDIPCFSAPFVVPLASVVYTGAGRGRYKCGCESYNTLTPFENTIWWWEGSLTESSGFLDVETTNLCDGTDGTALDVARVRSCEATLLITRILLTDPPDLVQPTNCYKIFWSLEFTATDNYDGFKKSVQGYAGGPDRSGCPTNQFVFNSCSPLDIEFGGDTPCLYGAVDPEICSGFTIHDQCVGSGWTAEVTE